MQDGKTEYKSVTVADNATAQEFMDFYLDDPSRHTWVSCHIGPFWSLCSLQCIAHPETCVGMHCTCNCLPTGGILVIIIAISVYACHVYAHSS